MVHTLWYRPAGVGSWPSFRQVPTEPVTRARSSLASRVYVKADSEPGGSWLPRRQVVGALDGLTGVRGAPFGASTSSTVISTPRVRLFKNKYTIYSDLNGVYLEMWLHPRKPRPVCLGWI